MSSSFGQRGYIALYRILEPSRAEQLIEAIRTSSRFDLSEEERLSVIEPLRNTNELGAVDYEIK